AVAAELVEPVGGRRVALVPGPRRIERAARPPADIDAGDVADGEGPHRHAEIVEHLVDLLRQGALVDEEGGLAGQRPAAAVGDETVADAAHHADLADR